MTASSSEDEQVDEFLLILNEPHGETQRNQARFVLKHFSRNLERAVNEVFEKGSLASASASISNNNASSNAIVRFQPNADGDNGARRAVPPPPPPPSSFEAQNGAANKSFFPAGAPGTIGAGQPAGMDPTRPPPYDPRQWGGDWSNTQGFPPHGAQAWGRRRSPSPAAGIGGRNQPIDLTSGEEDEELRRALQMSLQDQGGGPIANAPPTGITGGGSKEDDDLALAIAMSQEAQSGANSAAMSQAPSAFSSSAPFGGPGTPYPSGHDRNDSGRATGSPDSMDRMSTSAVLNGEDTNGEAGGAQQQGQDGMVPITLRSTQTPGWSNVPYGPANLSVRPEIAQPMVKSDETAPVGLVGGYPEAQSYVAVLQAFYAVPAVRRKVLEWGRPDPRPHDLTDYWKGKILPESTFEDKPEHDTAAETADITVQDTDMQKSDGTTKQEEDTEETKEDADATMKEGAGVVQGKASTSSEDDACVEYLQRLQTLFAFMQGSKRAWVQPDDLLSIYKGPLGNLAPLAEMPSTAYHAILEVFSKIHKQVDDKQPPLFLSIGAQSTEGSPREQETTTEFTLRPTKLHTNVQTALMASLAFTPTQTSYLIVKPARVLVCQLDNSLREGAPFHFDESFYIEPYLWEARNGTPLPQADEEEITRLNIEVGRLTNEHSRLSTFKGRDSLEVLQASIKYFEVLARDMKSEHQSAAKVMAQKLTGSHDSFQKALQNIKDQLEKVKDHADNAGKRPIETFLQQAKSPPFRKTQYELHAVVLRNNPDLFIGGHHSVVKGQDGSWWAVEPQSLIGFNDPGSVKKLDQAGLQSLDTAHATMAIYTLKEADEASDIIWPSQLIQAAIEKDNSNLASEQDAQDSELKGSVDITPRSS